MTGQQLASMNELLEFECVHYKKITFDNFYRYLILEHLAGRGQYYFLVGYLGYNQIFITPKDQENTTSPFHI